MKLGEVCEIYQPKTLSTDKLSSEGDYPVYGANGVIGFYSEFNHEEAEVLLTCRGATCGTINVSQPFSWINGNAMVIHRKSEELSFDFLRYLMLSLDYSLIITGAAQPQITRQRLAPTQISFPSLLIQRRIVDELDEINAIISAKKEQLHQLDELAQSIFYNMFGDPVANEKGWEVKTFKQCFSLKSGDGLSAKNFIDGPYPVYGGNGIAGHHNTYNKEGKNIIIGRVGALCGNVHLVEGQIFVTDNAFVLSTNENFEATLLLYLLRFLNLRQFARDALQPVISNTSLKDIKVILPPLPLQETFAARVSAIEDEKAAIAASIKKMQTLLNERMQEYFG